jgi:hypothetical protein
MILNAEDARNVVQDDSNDFEQVETEIVDTSRWSIQYEGVFKHIASGKYYSVGWQVGATESQDESPFEYETEVEFNEVEAKEVMVTKWVLKK